jgi:cell division protease FtsH
MGIFKVHTKKVPLDPNVDLLTIAKGTPGFSGADIENLVNEAALFAARRNQEKVTGPDFEYAKDKVMMGAERRSMVISEKEKRNTAVHEAGHALVAWILPGTDPVHKVTIIPRGRALGLTWQLPPEDRLNLYQQFALNQIAILMGGRLAEELTFGERSTGAGNDIERATELAHSMVCEWGMSEKLGPLAYGKKEGEVFLGREMSTVQSFSAETARDIDSEIRRIVTEQYEKAKKVLVDHKEQLARIADALVEYETLDFADIEVIMAGGTMSRTPPAKPMATTVAPEKKKAAPVEPVAGLPATGKA